ncbi:MAG: peroxide stress protein YaaA [Pseudonocardiales bacterium]
MRILLPPSETKSWGGRGRPLAARLDASALAEPRAVVLDALHALVRGDPGPARTALLLPPGLADDALAANAAVAHSPTTPALRRYTGVVYAGMDFAQLAPAAQRIAGRSTLIYSGLFGVVRGDEPVPLYRVPAKAVLPGLGIVGTFWRRALQDVVPAMLGRGLVVDLRSGDYSAMWRPDAAQAGRVLTIRVLSPNQRGGYAVLSYPSKFAKGRLAAALITRTAAGEPVEHLHDVAAAWRECGGARSQSSGATHLDLFTA